MSLLTELLAQPAWALIRSRGGDEVTLIGGPRVDLDRLADLPAGSGPLGGWDHLVLVPFAQIAERGFAVNADGTPLSAIRADFQTRIALRDLVNELPDEQLEFADTGAFTTTHDEYAQIVQTVIDEEIGTGEAANVVIAREYRAQVADWGHGAALSVLRRLLEREHGSYWTFCIFTGDRHLIGASPERHVSLDGGQLRMNPISGTFRVKGIETTADRERELLRFLDDEKEIYELFMVVDEELKMMCDLCQEGGLVLGPYLKPMAHLVHTEYLLAGRTSLDVRQILRDSMFAATVTGSPVGPACALIQKYEPSGRGYYSAVAALVGRDEDGRDRLDAPILLRTADVDAGGNLRVMAGATLVRDSDPDSETHETLAKSSGILSAFGLADAASEPVEGFDAFTRTDEVLIALGSRNQRASQFWFSDQDGLPKNPALAGREILLVDNDDDATKMLAHLLGALGTKVEIIGRQQWTPERFTAAELVVLAPGPGDPRDAESSKLLEIRAMVDHLLETGKPFLAVGLSHQVLCERLGMEIVFKDIVFQGTQADLPVLDRIETVGFYNTFVARVGAAELPAGVSVQTDADTGDVHLVQGPTFCGVQFHPESILTRNGTWIMRELVGRLLA